ncbi:hypothetical protein R0J91_16200, partial [Micrococcus sp. SIMBA_131]
IGQKYLYSGITWTSRILNEHPNIWTGQLVADTIYQLEKMMRSFIYNNRENIRRETKLKQKVLVIVYLLVEKGSVAGYMLRENVL